MRPALGLVLLTAVLAGCTPTTAEPMAPTATTTATTATTAIPTPAPTTAPAPLPSAAPFTTGLVIPWAVGGTRLRPDGVVSTFPGEWPDYRVPAIRLWDGFTTWANIEPQRGTWNWNRLDRFVAKARQRGTDDITLVLAGTPRWAAQRVTPQDAGWIGPGSASPPRDLGDWARFVREAAGRYAGRVTAYEIGNEPNLRTFWNGTPEEYADLVAVAAREIRAADPGATVVANIGLVRRPADIAALPTIATPLLARTATDGGSMVDVLSVHVYPAADRLRSATELLQATAQAIDALGGPAQQPWLTEVNVRDGAALRPKGQATAVARITGETQAAGFARAYWYAWTDLGPPDLIPLHDGTPADAAFRDGDVPGMSP